MPPPSSSDHPMGDRGRFELVLLFPALLRGAGGLGRRPHHPSSPQPPDHDLLLPCRLGLAIVAGIALGILMGLVKRPTALLLVGQHLLSAALGLVLCSVLFGMGAPTVIVTVSMFAVWIIASTPRGGSRLALAHRVATPSAPRRPEAGSYPPAACRDPGRHRLGVVARVKGVVIGQSWSRSSAWAPSSPSIPRNFSWPILGPDPHPLRLRPPPSRGDRRLEARVEYYAALGLSPGRVARCRAGVLSPRHRAEPAGQQPRGRIGARDARPRNFEQDLLDHIEGIRHAHICNALEVVQGAPPHHRLHDRHMVAPFPNLSPIVGYAGRR